MSRGWYRRGEGGECESTLMFQRYPNMHDLGNTDVEAVIA